MVLVAAFAAGVTCAATAGAAAAALRIAASRRHDGGEARAEQQREKWQRILVEQATREVKTMGFEVLTPSEEEEAISLATRAFAGASATTPFPTFEWRFGPDLYGKSEHPLKVAGCRFCVLRMLRNTVVTGGFTFGVREAGHLSAICVVIPLIAEDGSRGRPLSRTAELPPCPMDDEASYGKHPKLRDLFFAGGDNALLDQMHEAYAPFPHWHVGLLAVDPSAQGQGLGRRLLAAVHALADKVKVAVYLDTAGDRLRAFYEHLGYKVAGGRGYEVNLPGDPHPLVDPATGAGILRSYPLLRPAVS